MTTPTIVLIFFIILCASMMYIDYRNAVNAKKEKYSCHSSSAGWSFMFLIPLIPCILFRSLAPQRIEYTPTEYMTESTSFKIFVKTSDNRVFESDKKLDFEEWSQNKPGFIREEYNAFGIHMDIMDTFTVNKIETK